MGVFKMFSSSLADKKKSVSMFSHLWEGKDKKSVSMFSKWKDETKVTPINLPNPDPLNYTILKHKRVGGCLIIRLKYHDCVNYEGEKVLVFEKCRLEDLEKQKYIDPHFSDNKNFLSPIARFEPTQRGWNFAMDFALKIHT